MNPILQTILGKDFGKTLSISAGALVLILYVHGDAKQEIGMAEARSKEYVDQKIHLIYEPIMRELNDIKAAVIRMEKRTYENKK